MPRALTAAAVEKLKPAAERREIPDGGCRGLYVVVQPSGAKSWALRYRRPDNRSAKLVLGSVHKKNKKDNTTDPEPVIGGHLTVAAAHLLVKMLQNQIAQGRDPGAVHIVEKKRRRAAVVEGATNSFGQVACDFLEEHKVKRTGKRPRGWREIARVLGLDYPATGGDPTVIKGGLAERWSDKAIEDIDGHDIYTVVDEARRIATPGLASRTTDASDARGRKMADALGSLFKWAIRHRRAAMVANPCLGGYRPDAPAARDRVLNFRLDVRNADELRWFWSGCDAAGEPFGALLKLLLLTGCRLSEIARMTRGELSDDLATLRLPGERTKNNKPHDVPLPPLARDILASVKRIEGCQYIFSTNGKTPVSGFSKIKVRLDGAMLDEAGGATIAPWRLHDLRRTAATGMASIGIPPHIVEACLNHVSGAKGGVAGTYNRERYEPEKRAALERWAAHVQGLVSGRPAKVVPIRKQRA